MAKTPFGQVETTPPEDKKTPPTEQPPLSKEAADAVTENFETKKKEMIDQVEETFEKNISAGSEKIDERALTQIRGLKEKQKQVVADLFDKRRKAVDNVAGQQAADRSKLADQMLLTATEEARLRILELATIIEKHKKETYITTREAYEIEKAVLGVEKLAMNDKQAQALFVRIREGTELGQSDYEYVAGLLNPYDVMADRKDLQHSFEATSAGVFLGIMSPAQRYKLVQVFIDSPKKKDSAQLIDAFLCTGNLTREQGEALFQEAVAKGALTQEQFAADYKKKLDSGYYQEQVNKFMAILEEEMKRDYTGNFSENFVNRFVGAPAIGMAAGIWGFLVAAVNIMVTLANKDDKHKIASILKNPYVYAGFGGMAVGSEMMFGTLKKGSDLVGGGPIATSLEGASVPAEQELKTVERNARKQIAEVLNSPLEVVAFLDEGGFTTIQALRTEKISHQQKPIITVGELLPLEKNDTNRTRLEAMKHLEYVKEDEVNTRLTMVSEACAILKIDDKDKFTKLLAELRAEQKPKEGGTAVAAAPAAPPAAPAPSAPKKSPFKIS